MNAFYHAIFGEDIDPVIDKVRATGKSEFYRIFTVISRNGNITVEVNAALGGMKGTYFRSRAHPDGTWALHALGMEIDSRAVMSTDYRQLFFENAASSVVGNMIPTLFLAEIMMVVCKVIRYAEERYPSGEFSFALD